MNESHYSKRGSIEPLEFIVSNHMSFLEGNIIKYIYRYPFKGGVEDLEKARTYLDLLIAKYKGGNDGNIKKNR